MKFGKSALVAMFVPMLSASAVWAGEVLVACGADGDHAQSGVTENSPRVHETAQHHEGVPETRAPAAKDGAAAPGQAGADETTDRLAS
jgi:hypothetical protein